MKKPLKILLGVVAAFIAIVVVVIVAFALFFDPNDLRGKITTLAKEKTGRELTIEDIRLSLFPTLGARVRGIRLSNAEGFADAPFVVVGEVNVGVRVLPLLLRREVQVGQVTLSGLQLNAEVAADGRNNWQDLNKPPEAAEPAPTATSSGSDVQRLDIGGISIRDAALHYDDHKAGKSYQLNGLNLKTGAIAPGKPFDFTLTFSTEASAPKLKADVDLSARLALDLEQQRFTADKLVLKLNAALADLDATGTLSGDVKADLNTKLYTIEKIALAAEASGKAVPGGKQHAEFNADAIYDGGKGTVKLAAGELHALGLIAAIAIDGSGLNGDAPRFAGPFSVKPFKPRELLKTLDIAVNTADPNALSELGLKARLEVTTNSARINELVVKLDQSTLSGSAGINDLKNLAAEFALKLDTIDADRYLPPKTKTPAAAPATPADKAKADAQPLPIDALDTFTAAGTVDIGKMKLSGVSLSKVALKLNAVKGADKRIDLAANLYGGSLNNTTRITPGAKPRYAESLKLTSIDAAPLLKDFLGKDKLSGHGGASAELATAGKTMGELKRALNGDVSFELRDGAVKGFNLAQMVRKADALLTGTQLNETEPQQTDFTEFGASGKIVNGVLKSDALNAKSPLFRVDGAGQVDLANETLDYTAKPTIVNTISGQGGKDLSQLNGLTIPVRVTGPWSAPKYSIDLKQALAQKATDKLRNRLDDQLQKKLGDTPLKDKLSNTLNSLFGKKKKPDETPQQ